MDEIWKPLKGIVECGDYYEISNLGRVRSIDRYVNAKNGNKQFKQGKVLKQKKMKYGYRQIELQYKRKSKWYSVHRLVALAFIPNPNNLPEVNHINEITSDNHADNLEWCTSYYNKTYGSHIEKSFEDRGKKVVVFCKYTNNVMYFCKSVTEASRKTGICRRCIRDN